MRSVSFPPGTFIEDIIEVNFLRFDNDAYFASKSIKNSDNNFMPTIAAFLVF